LAGSTPGHMVRLETRRDKIWIRTAKKAVQYEEKVLRAGNETLKECVRLNSKLQKEGYSSREKSEPWRRTRIKLMKQSGWSLAYHSIKVRQGASIWPTLKRTIKDTQRQIWINSI